MSYYDDRRTSVRDRRRGDDDYYDSRTDINTRDNARSTALVRRRSDDSYDEEIRRDYSPGGGYYRETTIRKSGVRPAGTGGRARSAFDDESSYVSRRRDDRDYYGGGGGGYGRGDGRGDYDNRSRRSRRYSDDSSASPPPRREKKERRKSMPEEALEAVGLAGLYKTITGKKDRSRSRSSSGDRRSTRSRSRRGRSTSPEHRKEQMQQALKAAVLAGAASAWRSRKEDGGWGGEKGKRVLTAALTAGGVDGFINRDKDPEKHQFRDVIGSALAGVATDRLVNGPRSQSRGRAGSYSPSGRRRSSRSRSRVGDLLAGGTIAATAKKLADNVRGRSQSRGRDRSRDSYSDDSRSPPRRKSRSRSVIASGLSKVGLGSAADRVDPAGARERSRSRGGNRRRYSDDDYDAPRPGGSIYDPPNYDNRNVSNSRDLDSQNGAMVARPNSTGQMASNGYKFETKAHHFGDPETDSDSDLGSSSDDEQIHKRGKKKMLISGGLATIATIHAGKSVHDSMEKRKRRKTAVKEGIISKQEAQEHKTRDRLQEAASIGLAALGIKGAYSEWKEVKEAMEEDREQKEKNIRHARKRSARRAKYHAAGMNGDYANSAPTLGDPFYNDQHGGQQYQHYDQGAYMSGANGGPSPLSGAYHRDPNAPQYFDNNPNHPHYSDGNPYAYQQEYHPYNDAPYSAPPVQGGTGFPPPPVGHPQPPQ